MHKKFQLLIMLIIIAIMNIYIQPTIAQTYDAKDPSFLHGRPAGVSSTIAPAKKRGSYGYIDKTSKMVIPAEFEQASNFNNGYAEITKDGQSVLIDKTGQYVTPFYTSSKEMNNNEIYKAFKTYEKTNKSNYCIDPNEVRSKYSSYSVDGKTYEIFKQNQSYCFYEGRARVRFIGHFYKVRESRTGFINKERQMVIEPIYSYGDTFSEGLSAVTLPEDTSKYGYIDLNGKMVIPPKFFRAKPFKEGVAVVTVFDFTKNSYIGEGSNGLKGLIDKSGNYIVKPQYTELEELSEGLMAVKKDDKYGYIDKTGNIVIDFKYLYADKFYEGLARVKIEDE